MPTYKRALMEEHLRRMVDRGTIGEFLRSFAVNSALGGDQRTLIFLPGGLASELARANEEFDSAEPSNSYSYDTIWYDVFGVGFLQKALLLDMNGDEDKDRRLIVADGAIETCVYGPYDNFKTWCGARDIDLLVVGWDFRRRRDWIVEFIFDYLIPDVRQRAQDAGLGDPFARATLVGHSFGGMVCKWLMNEHARSFAQELQLVVTVGSPFYGYGGHAHRFFKGEPMVGSTYNLKTLTKVIATMKGGYSLMFCDGLTYDTYEQDLMADPKYRPPGYPSIDADNPAVRADPYNPGLRNAGESRYPQNWSWHAAYLAEGLLGYQEIAQPLDESVKAKFHCIRGVQVDGAGAPIANTRVSQRWSWVRSNYNPNSFPTPLSETQADMGFGDDAARDDCGWRHRRGQIDCTRHIASAH